MSTYEEIEERARRNGGCKDWPCDYACLRRGACDHEKSETEAKKVVDK